MNEEWNALKLLRESSFAELLITLCDGISHLNTIVEKLKEEIISRSVPNPEKKISKNTQRKLVQFREKLNEGKEEKSVPTTAHELDLFEEIFEPITKKKGEKKASSAVQKRGKKRTQGIRKTSRAAKERFKRNMIQLVKNEMESESSNLDSSSDESSEEESNSTKEEIAQPKAKPKAKPKARPKVKPKAKPNRKKVKDNKKSAVFKESDCRICLLALEKHESEYILPCCKRKCHLYCLNRLIWSRYAKLCPVCRTEISTETMKVVDRQVKAEKRQEQKMRVALKTMKMKLSRQ